VNSEILQHLEPELINCDGMHIITQALYDNNLTEETARMCRPKSTERPGRKEQRGDAREGGWLVATKQSSDS
jgi:hypothetical protein